MPPSEKPLFAGEVVATSKPAIVIDVVVVGSAIGDNQRVDAPSGRVLAYDARTGKALWQFDPVPRDPADPLHRQPRRRLRIRRPAHRRLLRCRGDRKSTRLNSSH